jgi:hypothetical protein
MKLSTNIIARSPSRKRKDHEKTTLWSEARSVYEAIKDEPYLDVAGLDLECWERMRGEGCIAELEQLMNRKLR